MWTLWMSAAFLGAVDLPVGSEPQPVEFPHFPTRLHACVWRNWQLVPIERMARVFGARPDQILALGRAMGLADPPEITADQQRRSYITVIRRNWHLLPYEQLLQLLDFTPDQLAYILREDDFLYIKLGLLKPACEPVRYSEPVPEIRRREEEIAAVVSEHFPGGITPPEDPLFAFVDRLSRSPIPDSRSPAADPRSSVFSPRYCYSYFALYGDPLLDREADPFPDGYLARLAASGVGGVWLQAVLYKLAPYPWDPGLSEHYEERLQRLRELVARARQHGMEVYLYLNEPRAMPLAFYQSRPELKGVVEGDHAVLCTSVPQVREYIRASVELICRSAPDLAGFFTITASENLTSCWSHGRGGECPRCGGRSPAEVIAEVNATIHEGIRRAGTEARLIAWDWGWGDDWAVDAIGRLPDGVALMSVSEWNIPIQRGGVDTICSEYSISTVGPGPRATRHWDIARGRGLPIMAKVQANNTWELSPVPYIPAVANVAQHAANLRGAGVDGLMLSWTLGGCPSPNLEVIAEIGVDPEVSPEEAMLRVARSRFGEAVAPAVVKAWQAFSAAFSEYPYHVGLVYAGPQQMGPANLLWGQPTGYRATMTGIPYDDLEGWRAVYPPEVFIAQFDRVADGFEEALAPLRGAARAGQDRMTEEQRQALAEELTVAEACAVHFRSVANQARFVLARNRLAEARGAEETQSLLRMLEQALQDEVRLAVRLYGLQSRDSRLGFEAANHYFYVPADLAEKVINCRDLLDRWLPAQGRD